MLECSHVSKRVKWNPYGANRSAELSEVKIINRWELRPSPPPPGWNSGGRMLVWQHEALVSTCSTAQTGCGGITFNPSLRRLTDLSILHSEFQASQSHRVRPNHQEDFFKWCVCVCCVSMWAHVIPEARGKGLPCYRWLHDTSYGCWEPKSSLQQVRCMLLTTEPSLKSS